MNITVYCGAQTGKDPEFRKRAAELGTWMAENGHALVYGAGDVGMMGVISNAVMEAGGEVIGVTPEYFIFAEEIHKHIKDLRITEDLSERRKIMINEGDAFIALPGGTGTLDEISEVMSLKRLGRLGSEVRPVMIYNINGYYDHFLRFLDRMTAEGFNREIDRAGILEVRSIGDIEKALMTAGTADTERITAYDK